MTLDRDDIAILRELIREELLAAGSKPAPTALPTRSEQIRAMARDPELARQLFHKNRKSPKLRAA
jgi:hypothetical protein